MAKHRFRESLAAFAGIAQYDEEGNYIPEQLVGKKTKELVMQYGDISSGEYARMRSVQNNASEELMNKLLSNEISFFCSTRSRETSGKGTEKFVGRNGREKN